MGDDKTLRRVLAHELAHHEDYMVNYLKQVPVMPEKPSGAEPTYEEQAAYADKLKDWIRKGKSLKFQMNMIGGHGAPWKEIANRFNARLGADFVTERSDEQYVRAPSNKEVFLLIRNWPGKEGEPYFVFQWAVRLGPAARKKLDKYWRLNPSFKLVKTPFAPFSYSKHTLGDDAYSREKPENHELLKQLWDTAPDLKGKTAKLPLVKTAPFVAAMNGVKGKIVGQNLGSLEIAQILSNALSRYQIEFKPGFGESGHPEQAKHYLTRAAIDENGGIEIEYENEFYTQFDDMQDYEWNSFVQTVASLVAHELTHRNQMESIKDKYQGETGANYVYKVDKAIRSLGADPDKTSQYLGNPHEVAAFAREAVEELRNIGYKDERILQILSTADLKDAAGDSHTLWTYWDFFGAGDPVFKRFMQQMYKVIANKEASEKEAKTGPHAKCVVMAGLPAPAAAAVVKAALSIPDEELGVDGREDDPHITVKFGVADDIDLLAATLQGVTPFSVTLGKLHVFVPSEASGRQAPVVAEAHAPQLKMLHDKVDAAMSIRPDDFPYSPHVTLAYVKSEVAAKYEGSDVCEGVTFQVNSLLLSRKGGDRSAVPFGKTADHKFVKEPRSAGDVLVAIDPKKLDEVWKNDPGFYIGPGGEGQIGSRYPRFQQWLKDNPGTPIEAPIVSWNPYNNTPSFTNGRHRFSVLRDLGAKKVYIAVPKEDVAIFKKFAARTEPPFQAFGAEYDIQKALEILQKAPRPAVPADRHPLVDVDSSHIPEVDYSKPGILATTSTGFQFLIDGNHRAEKAKQEGQAFLAYPLTAEETQAIKKIAATPPEDISERYRQIPDFGYHSTYKRNRESIEAKGLTAQITTGLGARVKGVWLSPSIDDLWFLDDPNHSLDAYRVDIRKYRDAGKVEHQGGIGEHLLVRNSIPVRAIELWDPVAKTWVPLKGNKVASHKTPPLSDTQYQEQPGLEGEGTQAWANIPERVQGEYEDFPLQELNPALFKAAAAAEYLLYHGTSVENAKKIQQTGFNTRWTWLIFDKDMARYYARMKSKDQPQYALVTVDGIKAGWPLAALKSAKESGNSMVSQMPLTEAIVGIEVFPNDDSPNPMPIKRGATYQNKPTLLDLGGGYWLSYAPHPKEGGEANTWTILNDVDKLFAVGEVSLYFYPDLPAPSINSIRLNDKHQQQGLGPKIVQALAKFYGGLTSDPQRNTNDYAKKMWRKIPGVQEVPSPKSNLTPPGNYFVLQAKGLLIGQAYLLHFDIAPGTVIPPTRSDATKPFHARHYLGWAEDAESRIQQHREGTAARLTQHLKSQGIGFQVAKIWDKVDRDFERRLKNQGGLSRHCPICRELGIDRDTVRNKKEIPAAPVAPTTGPDFVEVTATLEPLPIEDLRQVCEGERKDTIGQCSARGGDCIPVSTAVHEALVNRYPDAELVQGAYFRNRENYKKWQNEQDEGWLHTWVEIPSQHLYVDATHDQFGGADPIYIGHVGDAYYQEHYEIDEDYKTAAVTPAITLKQSLEALRPQMVQVAQKVYDENVFANNQDPEEEHGICDEIAQELEGVIASHMEAELHEGGQDGDDHAWVIVRLGDEACGVDIPPSVYETGGGYSWKLLPDVVFQPTDIEIWPMDMIGIEASIKTAKTPYPKLLEGLAAEAKKAPTFDEFEKDFIIDLKHGRYYHLTDNPNFEIDPKKGPRDMSSMAEGQMEPGKLMITSHLDNWAAYYGKARPYVAIIDMSAVPRDAYHQVKRGFGNEFWVENPAAAKVVNVMPMAAAKASDRRFTKVLEQTVVSEQDLQVFYEAATGKKVKDEPKIAAVVFNGGSGRAGKFVTYYTPNKEMAETYVEMYNDRFGGGGKLNEANVTIAKPAPWEVIRATAEKLGFGMDEVDSYTPASVFDENLFGQAVGELVSSLKSAGYDGAILDDIAYGKQIQDKAIIKFASVQAINALVPFMSPTDESFAFLHEFEAGKLVPIERTSIDPKQIFRQEELNDPSGSLTKARAYAEQWRQGSEPPPVPVSRLSSGRMVILNGQHRAMAAVLLGKDLPIEIFGRTKTSAKIFDRWQYGGCWRLAFEIHKLLPGSTYVYVGHISNKGKNYPEVSHVAVQDAQGKIWDSNGSQTPEQFLRKTGIGPEEKDWTVREVSDREVVAHQLPQYDWMNRNFSDAEEVAKGILKGKKPKLQGTASVKTAFKIEVPKSVRDHFWEEPPEGNLEFWAYRHSVNVLPGEKILFTFSGAPVARAVVHHTEAPGQSKCENTGKFKSHYKVYWDPVSFVRLDGK